VTFAGRAADERRAQESPEYARVLQVHRRIFAAMEDPQEIMIFIEYTGQRPFLGVLTGPSSCALVHDAAGAPPDDDDIRRRLRFDGLTALERSLSSL